MCERALCVAVGVGSTLHSIGMLACVCVCVCVCVHVTLMLVKLSSWKLGG